MHKKRILTALIAAPLLFVVVWWAGLLAFKVVVSFASAIIAFEYCSLCFNEKELYFWRLWGSILILIPIVTACIFESQSYIFFSLYVGLVLSIISILFTYSKLKSPFKHWAFLALGIFYLGLCLSFVILLRVLPFGKKWIVFLLVVIFCGDAGAYYFGKAFGSHKLCPSISKGKTKEGALGGIIINFVSALFMWYILFQNLNIWKLAFIAVFSGLVGQLGDLAASTVKRYAGAKDSGYILPGHGGFLDRLDAVILAAPSFYLLILFCFHIIPGVVVKVGAW